MGSIRLLLKALKLFIFENIYTHKIDIKNDRAIFSFTFDDVPISAATNGANILEELNVTGTYYVALGMEGEIDVNDVNKRRFISNAEIKSLYNNGHDIGCHTYSHLNLRKSNTKDVVLDCDKNTRRLQNIIKITSIDHFAYPFGMVSPGGKRELGRKYKTLRTTDNGINTGKTDFTHLRAISLCSNSFDKDSIQATISEATKNKAWVIFYSHDICENPSEWGTNTEDFKWVVEQCAKSDGEILNMSHAFNKIINNQTPQPNQEKV